LKHTNTVKYDLERRIEGARLISTSQFGDEIIRNM
jgi:isocitrate dehydrogenase